MAKIEMNLKIDFSVMQIACKKASDALNAFGKSFEELENQKIKIKELKPQKWWQFWNWAGFYFVRRNNRNI